MSHRVKNELRARGLEHEQGYVEKLRAQGLNIADLTGLSGEEAVARSIETIQSGVDVVLQPALGNGRWFGGQTFFAARI